MPKPLLHPHQSPEELTQHVAERMFRCLEQTLADKGYAHLSLTGGSMGIATLAAFAQLPTLRSLDFSRVHFWWSDERFLSRGDQQRNEQQAKDVLLNSLSMPASNLHTMGASDQFASAAEAAAAYAAELKAAGGQGKLPVFDLTLLGMGPDGHIASLFPGRPHIQDRSDSIAQAVLDSPKPPPERVTLLLPVINRSERIWFLLSGQDKADALAQLLEAAKLREDELTSQLLDKIPAAGARARQETLIFATADALTHP
ncbi:MAG: 6-phosphogluconolactonase [Rothia sp. (in: high G+C Gram-positive bacteria)]|nr:6-phosphogluconolactonase [Rothia sp. (in: high G+C Gram-positive bacteria)]